MLPGAKRNRLRPPALAAGAGLLLLAATLAVVAPGCRGLSSRREILTVGLQQEPDVLNPMLSSTLASGSIALPPRLRQLPS